MVICRSFSPSAALLFLACCSPRGRPPVAPTCHRALRRRKSCGLETDSNGGSWEGFGIEFPLAFRFPGCVKTSLLGYEMGNDKSRTSFPRKWESRRGGVAGVQNPGRRNDIKGGQGKPVRELLIQETKTSEKLDGVAIASCRLFRYRLPLVAPLPLAGGVIHERTGVMVRVDSESGVSGWGDVAPLPGFSRESVEEAVAELMAWAGRLRGTRFPFPRRQSRIVARARAGGRDVALGAVRPGDGAGEPVATDGGQVGGRGSGLLRWRRSRQRVAGGFSRGGAGGCPAAAGRGLAARSSSRWAAGWVAEDEELTRVVRAVIGDDVGLRLDANRSWSLEQAVEFGRSVGDTHIEYLEEPLRDPAHLADFFDATGISVALDESLLELWPDDLDGRREVGAVVLKPTLLGGISRAREWVTKALALNVRPVVSGCFESGVGLLALAEFAWGFHGGRGARGPRHLSLARRRRGPAAHSVPTGSHSMERRAGAGSPHRWIDAERDTA